MFAQRLRCLMNERNLSQVQLSKIAGTSEASISRYLSEATYMPSITVLVNISMALDVSIDWLMGRTSIPTPRKTEEEFGYVLYQCYARATPRDKHLVGTILNDYLTDEEVAMNYDLT